MGPPDFFNYELFGRESTSGVTAAEACLCTMAGSFRFLQPCDGCGRPVSSIPISRNPHLRCRQR